MGVVLVLLIIIGVSLSTIVLGVSYIMGVKRADSEKASVYECGFDPFGSLKALFSVRFFLVGVLFMIFDLEISLLFPWCVTLNETGLEGFWAMCIFMGVLTIGLIYEWAKGGLEWE